MYSSHSTLEATQPAVLTATEGSAIADLENCEEEAEVSVEAAAASRPL